MQRTQKALELTDSQIAEAEKLVKTQAERNTISLRNGISELETFEINGVTFELIYVQGEKFQMGYDPKRDGEDKYVYFKPLQFAHF